METKTKRAMLIKTDGYSIDYQFYDDYESARVAMNEQYHSYNPEELEDDWAELSYCSDYDAILYNNGEDVYVWKICEIPN